MSGTSVDTEQELRAEYARLDQLTREQAELSGRMREAMGNADGTAYFELTARKAFLPGEILTQRVKVAQARRRHYAARQVELEPQMYEAAAAMTAAKERAEQERKRIQEELTAVEREYVRISRDYHEAVHEVNTVDRETLPQLLDEAARGQ